MNKVPAFSLCGLEPGLLQPFSSYILPPVLHQVRTGEAQAYGVICGSHSCGAAAVRWQPDQGELLSLFIDPAVRRQGAAKALLEHIAAQGLAQGIPLLRADYVLDGEELTAMDGLFCHLGCQPQFRAPVFALDSARFHDDPLIGPCFTPGFVPPASIVPFLSLSEQERQALAGRAEIPDHLQWEACRHKAEPALCFAWVEKGEVAAYVLGGESADGGCLQLATVRTSQAPPSAVIWLLRTQINAFYYRCGGDFLFYASTITPHSRQILERIAQGRYRLYEEHEALWPFPAGRLAPDAPAALR